MLLLSLCCSVRRECSYPQGSIKDQQKSDMSGVILSSVVVTVVVLDVDVVVVVVVKASSLMACCVAGSPSSSVFHRLQSCCSDVLSQGHMRTLLPSLAKSRASMQKPRTCRMRPVTPSKFQSWLAMFAVHGCRCMPPPWLRYSTESMQRPCLVPMTPALLSMYHCWLSFVESPHAARCKCSAQSRQMPWRFLIWKVNVFLPGRPDTKALSLRRMSSSWFLR
mmetsp:Transcript_118375/g.330170  ORF Transcript_118375/g.330170 Transcript_118375/m.330170 type:complete len:221 (-) Transcript_118375:960-1622(-)